MATTPPPGGTGPSTHKEFHINTDWAARCVNNALVLSQFAAGVPNAKTGDQLHDDIKRTAEEMPHMCLMHIRDSERITTLHRATHFPAPVGSEGEPWMEKLLGFNGDVVGDQLPQPAITPPRILSTLSGAVKTVKLQKMLLEFQIHDALQTFTQDMDGCQDEDCDTVTTRSAVCVPADLADVFLGERLAPRTALIKVHGWCTENQKLDSHAMLLDWLWVICMEEGRTAVGRAQHPTVPLTDRDLIARLKAKVRGDLPGWQQVSAPASPPPPGPGAPTAAWERLITRVLDERTPAAAPPDNDADKPKKPSDAWKGTANILLRLCQANNEDSLPQLWHDWANCKKELRRTVLQEHFRRMARTLKLPAPVAAQELTTVLCALAFAAAHEGNLDQGLQPFLTSYLGEQSLSDQQALNEMNDLMREGTPSLTDIINLKAASKLAVPTKESQANRTLRAFAVVLAVSLGLTHPCYREHRREIVDKFETVQPKLESLAESHPRELVHAQLLRWTQLRFQEHWTELELTIGEASAPRFAVLHEDTRFQQWRRPDIPPSCLPTPKQSRAREGPKPAETANPATKRATDSSYAANPHKVQKLLEHGAKIGCIAGFLKETAEDASLVIPKMDSGSPMCFAWHLKGGCCTNCQRCQTSADAHGKLNNAEQARLEAYLQGGMQHIAGKHVDKATNLPRNAGWHRMCYSMRSRRDTPSSAERPPHPAAPLLTRLRRNGAPVAPSTEPWHPDLLHKRFKRGPHKSACEFADFLQEEFLEFARKGFWVLLPCNEAKDLPGLRLSPLGVVPQRDRRPRIIVDCSFYGINDDTIKLCPRESMQFGKANERPWRKLATANSRFGPIHMCKIDTSDGFYRVHLSTSSMLKLGVCLPRFPGLPPLVAFPMVLPMGWTESPPCFCSFTETACDLANHDLVRRRRSPPHRLEHLAALGDFQPNPCRGWDLHPARPTPKSHEHQITKAPLAHVDVFVDDFLGIGQDHPSNPLENQRRVLMSATDKIFRPTDADDHEWRKEPQSESKLKKQDASFQTLKRGLGWDHAVKSKNLLVAPHRQEKLASLLDNALHRKRFQLRDWQSLVGQLRSLTPGLPGSQGHFSMLQAVQQAAAGARARVTAMAKTALTTFQHFLQDDTRPAHLEELVPGRPIHIGACDAAKSGAGGVWFAADDEPLVWRKPFPAHIQDQVVSASNPRGRITNSDLELSGTTLHQDVLGQHTPLEGETAHTFCDNTPAVSWRNKGSLTSAKAAAFLLQDAALPQ